jgi:hypothetical protein
MMLKRAPLSALSADPAPSSTLTCSKPASFSACWLPPADVPKTIGIPLISHLESPVLEPWIDVAAVPDPVSAAPAGMTFTTPGSIAACRSMTRTAGSSVMIWRVSTCCCVAFLTSTIGASPETVTDSATEPRRISPLTWAAKLASSRMFSRRNVENPSA